jgi:DNA-binding HxlR family transcriptional regulator
VLQARLSELRKAGFLDLAAEGGYSLTPLGQELCETFMPLHRFAERWRKVKVDRGCVGGPTRYE